MHTVPGEQGKRTYSGTLLRDGTLYFLVLAILNSLHLVFSMLSIAVIALQPTSYITAFTDPITSILVSRFLIDLQEIQKYKADPQLSSLSVGWQGSAFQLATLSRIIGSLGESLPAPGAWDTSLLEDERVAAEDASASEDFDSYGSEEVGQDVEADAIAEEAGA
ncbi:hypothetical protein L226DRAFT_143532 [Lentinus tigrinus ALCF2SS1-7]|nr:hypothetical protein L226DRAFT_143532 [Lentinus tigrinus ALCF2SS1-7]